jgi:hypothetical protein
VATKVEPWAVNGLRDKLSKLVWWKGQLDSCVELLHGVVELKVLAVSSFTCDKNPSLRRASAVLKV